MWSDILNIAISNGIFCALFVALLIYELKDSNKREIKYQQTIEALSNKLNTVDEIKQDVTEIKNCLNKRPLKQRGNNEKTNNKL